MLRKYRVSASVSYHFALLFRRILVFHICLISVIDSISDPAGQVIQFLIKLENYSFSILKGHVWDIDHCPKEI